LRVLTRQELTAALAARQGLITRWRVAPPEAIARLTPLQGQEVRAPFVALAARLDHFTRSDLERAIDARAVVRTTIMRQTLHLAAAADYPAYAQLACQARMRAWRKTYPHLDENEVRAQLTAWFARPRTNAEIRERVLAYDGVPSDPYTPVLFARTLLPLVQLPPAGHWSDNGRGRRFAPDPRPLPPAVDAGALVLTRYLEAFGPAAKRDVAAWAGVAQADFPFERVATVAYRDEKGRELLDLPDRPLPPASTPLPPRFLANWDQPLLAYADRDRIIPPAILPLQLTLSGDQTVTVDGRVAASWRLEQARLTITPHTDIARGARAAIREEGLRTARCLAPDLTRHEVVFSAA
jgi:hypothetical protein